MNHSHHSSALNKIPTDWTPFSELGIRFIEAETLCWTGRAEMRIEQLYGPNGSQRGSRHYFRRIAA